VGKNGHATGMNGEGLVMSEFEQQANHSGLNIHDVIFSLLRHKWKILFFTLAGLMAAAGAYFVLPPVYESQAKLFVRYVVDKSAVDGLDSQVKTPNPQTDMVINSEVEILTSSDLAREVAQAVGVRRLVPGPESKATMENAIQNFFHGLDVNSIKATNIISVAFRSTDPQLPMPVLQELVSRYFTKHLDVHRSAGAFQFVTQEADQIRKELSETEAQLKELKDKAGVISLAESRTTLTAELGKSQEELDSAESELASQQARVKELEKSLAVTTGSTVSETNVRPVGSDVVQEYQALFNRLTQLRQAETELLSKYTPQNRIVKVKQAQIAELEKQRHDLEKKYPALVDSVPATASPSSSVNPRPDILSERAKLAGMDSRVAMIKARVNGLQQRANLISELGPQIEQLERKKEVEEANFKQSQASLEKARIDETLDPSRIPNISVVQTPSPAVKMTRDAKKIVLGLAVGGLAVGVALALLIELVLDRTVKRSNELEKRLRIPLLLSIPYMEANGQRLRLHDAGHDSETEVEDGDEVAPFDAGESLRPFCEAIRDRLGMFFEMNSMAHKPKLVAVAGLSKNAGASTLAAGLAGALSETADGKVLLVDKPVGPKRFYNMLVQFKESDLDYVVFDMPSVGDTSATLPLAGFMDTVLLVVEAEKNDRDAVKRAYSQLSAKTKVSVIFNKSRSYGPKWLEGEQL
jgi:uncharacterized protein involved in exopolysaccharide biosynthesis